MANKLVVFLYTLMVLTGGVFTAQDSWASQPNIVLSRALHFSAPDGTPITLGPGKYFVEPAGGSELRLMREGRQKEFILQAEASTHEQYELFSPMALTRPAKHDQYFIVLLLPGGQKLEAKGSTKSAPAPSPPTAVKEPAPQPRVTTPNQDKNIANPTPTIVAPTSVPQSISPAPVLAYKAPSANTLVPPVEPTALQQNGSMPLLVVAPDHLGHTIHAQPTLYWYLSEATNHPIDMILTEQGEVDVVFDMQLLPPMEAGMHHISLEDYGIRLLQDVPYQWEVKLMTGSSESGTTASGFIKRVTPSASMPKKMNQNSLAPDAPRLYAHSGLWYDAFWAISNLIHAEPHNTVLLEQRASLLDQVGLTHLGNLDRNQIEAK